MGFGRGIWRQGLPVKQRRLQGIIPRQCRRTDRPPAVDDLHDIADKGALARIIAWLQVAFVEAEARAFPGQGLGFGTARTAEQIQEFGYTDCQSGQTLGRTVRKQKQPVFQLIETGLIADQAYQIIGQEIVS
ncbi:hypothetical protein GSbR_34460 [Geobacter sp. SVR]|nr:hypothetical protein GSVR_29540 [Geobacter sp. SVR]GCF86846.1 hypothetical protein GSbR_34460 [Geobacter sp. SVR]